MRKTDDFPDWGRDELSTRCAGPRLIDVLVHDSRISMRSLAEKTHISRAHAYVRVERLQREGVIRGFTTQIEHSKAGWGSSAFVSLTIKQGSWRGLAHQLRSLCWVDHFALFGADFDVLILVRAPDNSTLRRLVLEQLQNLEGVRSTTTWLLLDEAHGPGPRWV